MTPEARLAKQRYELYKLINDEPLEREQLEKDNGTVWDQKEAEREFSLVGFYPPFAVVRRRRDNQLATLLYQEFPRYYFSFSPQRDMKPAPALT